MVDTSLNTKPAFTLTISEFFELLKAANQNEQPVIQPIEYPSEQRFEYSSRTACKRLGISVVTFQDWKNKNYFSFTQVGRKCIYDIPLILSELAKFRKGVNSKKTSIIETATMPHNYK